MKTSFDKLFKIILITCFLSLAWMSIIIPLGSVPEVSAATTSKIPQATVYMSPFRVEGTAGSTVTIDLKISNVTNLFAFQAGFIFDPNIVNTTKTSFTEGGFLSNNGIDQVLWFLGDVDNVHGYAAASAASLTNTRLSKNGSGTLMHATFRMKATGFSDIYLVDPALISNDAETSIPMNTVDYRTTVLDGTQYITKIVGNPMFNPSLYPISHVTGFNNFSYTLATKDIGGLLYHGEFNFTVTSQGANSDFFAYFNVTIPNNLMWGTIPTGWLLLKDNVQQSIEKITANATHTTISFQFTSNQMPQAFSIYSAFKTIVPDVTPPTINSLSFQPTTPFPYVPSSTPRQGESVLVEANVTEEVNGSGIYFVQLWFSTDSGPFMVIPMIHNNGLWEATIPEQIALTQVDFYIVAQDFKTNNATSPVHSYVAIALIPGDINGDGTVNILDAALLGMNWHKAVPPAPALADVNGDGIIDIGDAAIVSLHWLHHE